LCLIGGNKDNGGLSAHFLLLILPEKPCRVFFIEIEEVFDPFRFIGKGLRTVAQIHDFIEFLVGFYQRRLSTVNFFLYLPLII